MILRTTSLFTQKLQIQMGPLCGLNSKVLRNETNALQRAPFNQTPRAERQTTGFVPRKCDGLKHLESTIKKNLCTVLAST